MDKFEKLISIARQNQAADGKQKFGIFTVK